MLAKHLPTVNVTGLDAVVLRDDVKGHVTFVRKTLAEQSEAGLLKQLEVAEDTVKVLEGLLKKAAEEILRLEHCNEMFRWMQRESEKKTANPGGYHAQWPISSETLQPGIVYLMMTSKAGV